MTGLIIAIRAMIRIFIVATDVAAKRFLAKFTIALWGIIVLGALIVAIVPVIGAAVYTKGLIRIMQVGMYIVKSATMIVIPVVSPVATILNTMNLMNRDIVRIVRRDGQRGAWGNLSAQTQHTL
jgi:hypothetical protein